MNLFLNKVKYNHADAVDEAMFKKKINYPAPGTYGSSRAYISDTPIYSMSKLEREVPGNDKYLLT